jgi:hypothetical protein
MKWIRTKERQEYVTAVVRKKRMQTRRIKELD